MDEKKIIHCDLKQFMEVYVVERILVTVCAIMACDIIRREKLRSFLEVSCRSVGGKPKTKFKN